MENKKHIEEFEKQVGNLLQKGYPKLCRKTEEEFSRLVKPFGAVIENLSNPTVDIEKGYLPFVLVVKSELIIVEKTMSLVEKEGQQGITKLDPHQSKDFQVIQEESIPERGVYLLLDIDRGKETLNLAPSEAMKRIRAQDRSPLTIEEGVAIVTHYPEFLIKNNCFSLLASRHPGDKRVPAIWINGQKHPNLGWCWEGNPHTWLGSASCGGRLG
ncbi:hypothetical protein HGB07_02965 [Candidatus Roizmanbacteria bacterium]|nr:hypothetical protein [Candidatus Roizmanbacteria bacterium]